VFLSCSLEGRTVNHLLSEDEEEVETAEYTNVMHIRVSGFSELAQRYLEGEVILRYREAGSTEEDDMRELSYTQDGLNDLDNIEFPNGIDIYSIEGDGFPTIYVHEYSSPEENYLSVYVGKYVYYDYEPDKYQCDIREIVIDQEAIDDATEGTITITYCETNDVNWDIEDLGKRIKAGYKFSNTLQSLTYNTAGTQAYPEGIAIYEITGARSFKIDSDSKTLTFYRRNSEEL
jgi:hypothetical protein